MRTKRRFTVDFKRKVSEEIRGGILSMAQAIRQYELSSNLVYNWLDKYDHGKLENKPSEQGALENKIADLERKIGRQAMEIDLLKKAKGYYQERLSEKSLPLVQRKVYTEGVKS